MEVFLGNNLEMVSACSSDVPLSAFQFIIILLLRVLLSQKEKFRRSCVSIKFAAQTHPGKRSLQKLRTNQYGQKKEEGTAFNISELQRGQPTYHSSPWEWTSTDLALDNPALAKSGPTEERVDSSSLKCTPLGARPAATAGRTFLTGLLFLKVTSFNVLKIASLYVFLGKKLKGS